MPILFEKLGVAYFAIPKVASTSIKQELYRLETGKPFSRQDSGGQNIHKLFRAKVLRRGDFEACNGLWKFAVFRDPVKRVVSTYSNRVIHHRALERERRHRLKVWRLGVSLEPDLDEFCLNIAAYRKLSRQVMHHSRPYSQFVGHDLRRLDAIYRIEELDRLAEDLSSRLGVAVEFPRLQTGGPKFSVSDLSSAALDALIDFTRDDYALLDGLYEPPTARQV